MNQFDVFSVLKRKWVAVLSCIILLLFLLMKTHLGNRVAIALVTSWVPGLHVALDSGRLLSGGLTNISYETQGVSISINDMRLTVRWFDCATLCIGLKSTGIKVSVAGPPSTKDESVDSPTSDGVNEQTNSYLSLPVSIGIETLSIETIDVDTANMELVVDDFEFTALGKGDKLNVSQLSAQSVEVKSVKASANNALSVPEQLAPLMLPDIFFPLNLDVNKVLLSKFIYLAPEQQPIELSALSLAMKVDHQLVQVEQFELTHQDFSSYIDLNVNLGTYHVEGIAGVGMPTGAAVMALKGNMDKLSLHGRVSGRVDARLDLQVTPTVLNWPYQLEAQLSNAPITKTGKLTQFTIVSGGDLNNYRAQVKGTIDAPELLGQAELVSIEAAASGSLSQVRVESTRIAMAEAFTELTGQISWQNGLQASAQGALFELPLPNLGLKRSAVLSGQYDLALSSFEDSWLMNINELDLHGVIADMPLNISISGDVNDQYIGNLKRAEVQYGKSSIKVTGSLAEEVDLRLQANINHSANTILPVNAILGGHVKVVGSVFEPFIDLNLAIDQISAADFSLQQGNIVAQLDSKNNYQSNIELYASNVDFSQLNNAKLRFELRGDRAAHAASIMFGNMQRSFSANVSGHIDKDIWRGQVEQSAFEFDALNGELAEPVSLKVGLAQLAIADHCWRFNQGQACLKAQVNELQGDAELRLEHIALHDTQKWIGNGVTLDGELNGHAKVSVLKGDIDEFNSQFQVNQARITIVSSDEAAQSTDGLPARTLNIDEFKVSASGTMEQLQTQWHVEFEKLGLFKGELSFADLQQEKQASGYIEIDGVNLDELTPHARTLIWPDIDLTGEIDGRVNFSGDVLDPLFSGQLRAQQISVQSSYLPLQVTQLNLSADFIDRQVKVLGDLKTSQEGMVQLAGDINWQSGLQFNANMKGRDLLLTPMSGVQVAISPDLRVKYARQLLDLAGEVVIPHARFTLDTLPEGAVLVSDDQVIIDDLATKDDELFVDYQADVDIKLLDDVRISALGLDAYLTGALDIERQSGNALLMGGEVSLREGKFTAFGQDLIIEQGQLGFNGAPDKPYLNIRAIRNPDTTANDVIAGVMATGSVASPHLTIFSEPAMDQARALEYLLNGEPLGASDGSNNTLLAQFLLAKGIDKSKGLFTKAGKKLGLRDINLAAKGSGDDTQVELSGYITPSVQVSYRVGVFASLSEIAVRYRIFSKLYIEATSGLYDSIDLLYKFDWGD
ncbi:hypothetical protein N473_12835 [Pseudoalteromonas luteoviolacea CPMOR-1]|uniref:Translocation and assembly module TamB C-terminal domain-containing protein n=2 Tax=Pseudoalteromonas luteoviolacea TaxID=43657 RepID=A0A162BQ05_9GAMM|nr:hypothetical protein N473_12835 [Pseudoalteromonas luteoviolacea CPMOR-1]